MLERPEDASSLQLEDVSVEEVPSQILEIIGSHKAFSASATFGSKGLGAPEEYEKLVVSTGNSHKTFEYFNKAIHFMTASSEEGSSGESVGGEC